MRRDTRRDAIRGLTDLERKESVAAYFARFVWQPLPPDPRHLTAEQFFSALDDAVPGPT